MRNITSLLPIWVLLAGTAAMCATPNALHLSASKGQLLGGVTVATDIPGYTGSGYVTRFVNANSAVNFSFNSPAAGLFKVFIRYSAPFGTKNFDLVVNGATSEGTFVKTGNTFALDNAGLVELNKGPNTLAVQKDWGYYDLDTVNLVPAAALPRPLPVSAKLADPDASPQAKKLMRLLVHLYGAKTLSGQYNANESQYIQQVTGKAPAILGGDFMDYSPSRVAFGTTGNDETEKMIASARQGQIVTMVWHWNAPTDLINTKAEPWFKGFYTKATTFNLADALAHPGSKNYSLLLSNMDAIAAQLQKFNKAGIPVLWRPLHEAQGGWFWWGASGPAAFKQLWQLMFNRFTYHDHLHNLIWVDCSGLDPAWYPGNKYVDIIGIDEYPTSVTDPLSSIWQTLQKQYNGQKLVALTEFGGVPDVAKMNTYGIHWSYFVSWTGGDGPHKMTPDALKTIYQSPLVITQGALTAGVSH